MALSQSVLLPRSGGCSATHFGSSGHPNVHPCSNQIDKRAVCKDVCSLLWKAFVQFCIHLLDGQGVVSHLGWLASNRQVKTRDAGGKKNGA